MQAANNGRSRAMDAGTDALWAQMYSHMAGGTTKQRLSGVEQMQARRRRGARARARSRRSAAARALGLRHACPEPHAQPRRRALARRSTRVTTP